MADRIRKTETSQGSSNKGGLMDVIFNSCSGKVKTTEGQCVSLSHQDCRKPEEKNQRPCWTHLTRATLRQWLPGGRWNHRRNRKRHCLRQGGERGNALLLFKSHQWLWWANPTGAWLMWEPGNASFGMMLIATKQSQRRKTWESKWVHRTGVLGDGNTRKKILNQVKNQGLLGSSS